MAANTEHLNQIILGRLGRLGLQSDDILITELDQYREGFESYFHIRKLHGGLYSNLGYWKLNFMTGNIIGIAKDENTLDKLVTFDNYVNTLNKIQAEEIVYRMNYSEPAKMLEIFSAENIQSLSQLLFPTNYVRKTLNSVIQKAFKPRHGIPFNTDALPLPQAFSSEICTIFDFPYDDQITVILRDLSSYSASAINKSKIETSDVEQAQRFARALLILAFHRFSTPIKNNLTISDSELSSIKLITAFYPWRVYRRLPSRYKTHEMLLLLIIQNACLHYALDNFPGNIDDAKKYMQ